MTKFLFTSSSLLGLVTIYIVIDKLNGSYVAVGMVTVGWFISSVSSHFLGQLSTEQK